MEKKENNPCYYCYCWKIWEMLEEAINDSKDYILSEKDLFDKIKIGRNLFYIIKTEEKSNIVHNFEHQTLKLIYEYIHKTNPDTLTKRHINDLDRFEGYVLYCPVMPYVSLGILMVLIGFMTLIFRSAVTNPAGNIPYLITNIYAILLEIAGIIALIVMYKLEKRKVLFAKIKK
jgi:hypothetical protein